MRRAWAHCTHASLPWPPASIRMGRGAMGPVGTFPWEGARMRTKRHAVVVTHSRLRQEGTVVAEAVD